MRAICTGPVSLLQCSITGVRFYGRRGKERERVRQTQTGKGMLERKEGGSVCCVGEGVRGAGSVNEGRGGES